MKTITAALFALFFFLASLFASAQSKSDKIYDVFSNKEGVTNFTFSKNMIDAIDIDLGDDDDERNVTGDLHKIRFMSYNPEKGSHSGPEFTKKAIAMLPAQYKKYVDEEDDNSDAEIWLLGKKKKFAECHVFVKNERDNQMRFIVSFYGDFTVNDIDGLKKTGKGFSEE
ncbi:MAG: DUF4252 domain-containing protein [Bacteroidota bacterium]